MLLKLNFEYHKYTHYNEYLIINEYIAIGSGRDCLDTFLKN